jgi:predicted Zn-dependent protease
MLEVLEILKQASNGPRPPEILSSHPLPETRIAELEAYLKGKGSKQSRVGSELWVVSCEF